MYTLWEDTGNVIETKMAESQPSWMLAAPKVNHFQSVVYVRSVCCELCKYS